MADENVLHEMGRMIESTGGGTILQIDKRLEVAGALKAYIFLIIDAQLNIQNGTSVSAMD